MELAHIPKAIDRGKLTSAGETMPVKPENALSFLILAIKKEKRPTSADHALGLNNPIECRIKCFIVFFNPTVSGEMSNI